MTTLRRILLLLALLVVVAMGALLLADVLREVSRWVFLSILAAAGGIGTAMLTAEVRSWQHPKPEEPPQSKPLPPTIDAAQRHHDAAQRQVQRTERKMDDAEAFISTRTAKKTRIRIDDDDHNGHRR